jgi:hypothetical protein
VAGGLAVLGTRRGRLVALALLGLLFAAVAWSQVRQSPPRVWAELPEGVTAGEPFGLFLSADRPVVYRLRYGEQAFEEVSQDLRLELVGLLGEHELEVVAEDGSGAESRWGYRVLGLAPLRPLVGVPGAVVPGQPFAVQVEWAVPDETLTGLSISLDGEALTVFRGASGATAVASIPLGAGAGSREVTVVLGDSYGRRTAVTRKLAVTAGSSPVQLVNMPKSTLSVVTPENQAREAEVLAAAYEDPERALAPLWAEPFSLPAQGRFTSPFGLPRRYLAGGKVSYHHGTDIAAPQGTPVYAANAGLVVVADFYPIRGGLVVIDHGAGVHSLYFHQSRLHVEIGDEVTRGQTIGEIGTTGLSTGPHLHWEMRVRGVSTDPLAWVDKVWP